MIRIGDELLLLAEKRFEAPHQLRFQHGVLGEFGEGQRAIPGADFGVVDDGVLPLGQVGTGDEIGSDALADFLGGFTCGPRAEIIGGGGGDRG